MYIFNKIFIICDIFADMTYLLLMWQPIPLIPIDLIYQLTFDQLIGLSNKHGSIKPKLYL